jgi:hypothetical protein
MWASVGFLVAGCWALYAFATTPPAMTSADPILTLVEFTCPVAFASPHFHFGVSLYWSLLANAAAYALSDREDHAAKTESGKIIQNSTISLPGQRLTEKACRA